MVGGARLGGFQGACAIMGCDHGGDMPSIVVLKRLLCQRRLAYACEGLLHLAEP